jgi:hypothetical protein
MSRSLTTASSGVHPPGAKYHRHWEPLLEYINAWASAREAQGGIEVAFEQSPGLTRTVELVMTSADWDVYGYRD